MVKLSDIEDYKRRLYTAKGRRDELLGNKAQLEIDLDTTSTRLANAEQARIILQIVAQKTQKKLEYHISSLVTTALRSVLPEPPDFKAEFVTRRNKTECDLLFVMNGEEYLPKEGSGGGAKDIASFAFRVSRWGLNKNRPTMILDEPFRNVSPDLQHKVSEMLKMVSSEINLQIIMVSHAVNINACADKVTEVVKEKGVSKCQYLTSE